MSNLVKQVQMLVEENITKSVVAGGQAKNEERNGAEAKAPTASHFHLHSDHKILDITNPLTCSRSKSVDLRGPSMSLIGLVMRSTPTKEETHSMKGEEVVIVKNNQESTRECYLNFSRKEAPRGPSDFPNKRERWRSSKI
ncbi:hypothetical protein Fot_24420 [Forsythia ovata]|uniref:Uncharacterized protein n=1 Tax=Forsythia ovata TaxID=205694 RepID=A0ABD1U668_9LAMI